jgi:hypothetical protein
LDHASSTASAMLKHCLRQSSSNAQACRRLTVCGWCAGPMASMSRSRAAAVAGGRQRSNPRSQNWSLALAKRVETIAHCRGIRRRPRDAHSNLVSSSRLVPLRPQYYFRRSKGAIRMLLATADERSVSYLKSQVSCLMFRVTVSSRFIVRRQDGATGRERSRGSQST